jgi:hypothetical protein
MFDSEMPNEFFFEAMFPKCSPEGRFVGGSSGKPLFFSAPGRI